MEKNIFDDLEIDVSTFLTQSGAPGFVEAVLHAAKELENIMDNDTSVAKLEREAKERFKNNPVSKPKLNDYFADVSTKLYEDGEKMDMDILFGLVGELRQLAYDLENTFRERLRTDAAKDTANIFDKKQAQIQHKKLREAYDIYRKLIGPMYNLKMRAITPRPGNYTASMTDTILYRFDNGDEYFNFRAVAKRLEIWEEGFRFQDLMDWTEENPNVIEVVKVQL